jgi:hypothetical protein
MSTPYGMAAVTAVLRKRLGDRLTDADVQSAIGPVTVTSVPPDEVQAGASEPNQLNVYLHHAAPNAAWRNEAHPVRDSTGRRVTRAPLVLDLQYLITAFGVDTYAAEILLGHAMAELHERPLLDLASIDGVLHPAVPDASIPTAVAGSGLEDQDECLRVSPVAVGSEEMSRLWQALGAQYRATAAYQVGPLLIDPAQSAATALPVLTPSAIPATITTITVTDVVLAPTDDRRPSTTAPILATSRVLVRGDNVLAADRAIVGRDEIAVAGTRPDGVVLDLAAATALSPGPVTVQLLQGELTRSNIGVVAVRPVVAPTRSGTTVNCAVTPAVGRDQRVVLLLNQRNAPGTQVPLAHALDAPPGNGAVGNAATSSSVPFDIADVDPASYLVRLEVDGVASLLGTDSLGRFDAPTVNVP